MGSTTGLLTRGSLLAAFPACASGFVAEEQLPLQRRDRPGLTPGSLTVLRDCGRAYHRTVRGPFVRNWLPVLVWAAVIFSFSSIPDLGTGLGTWDLVLRKLAHTAEYAILGALLVRATGRAGLALVLGTLYAVSDEVHQVFVAGRHGSPIDVAIDAVGIAIGIALWQTLRTRRLA